MATTTVTTVEELMALDDEWQYELIDGELIRMPMGGGQHGEIEMEIGYQLRHFAGPHDLGKTYPGDTLFIFQRDPLVVLMPDIAFVRTERLPPAPDRIGAMPVIPDLAVEIVSPTDRLTHAQDKIQRYLNAGVPLVWLVEPKRRLVTVYRPGLHPLERRVGDELSGDPVLPGFRMAVADLFKD